MLENIWSKSRSAAGPQVYPFEFICVCLCVAVANFYKWKIPTTLLLQLQAIYTRAKNEAKHVLLKEKNTKKINMLRTCVWVYLCVCRCIRVCVWEATNTKMHVKMWRKMVGTHKHSCRIDISPPPILPYIILYSNPRMADFSLSWPGNLHKINKPAQITFSLPTRLSRKAVFS